MGVLRLIHPTQILQENLKKKERSISQRSVPKGHLPIYVGENQKRFVMPVAYVNHPLFQSLLERAADEFGLDHRGGGGGLRIPCNEEEFLFLLDSMKRGGDPILTRFHVSRWSHH